MLNTADDPVVSPMISNKTPEHTGIRKSAQMPWLLGLCIW